MADGLRILGPLELEVDGGIVALPPKVRRLVALLALQPNEWISTGWLVDALWEGDPPRTAANTLQTYVKQVRQVLAAPWAELSTWGGGYRFDLDDDHLDARCFERLASAARAGDVAAAVRDQLGAALALWRGDALADLVAAGFTHPAITRLDRLRLDAIEDGLELDLELGQTAGLDDRIQLLLVDHPYRERLVRLQMLVLYRDGRAVDALRRFQDYRRVLADEVGVAPGPSLAELELAILERQPELEVPDATSLEIRTGLDGVEAVALPTRTQFALVGTQGGSGHVAFQVVGDGPIDVLVVPGFLSHVEYQWQFPWWVRFHRRVGAGNRLLLFDKRGTGLSDPLRGGETVHERAEEVLAVLDAAGSDQAVLVGISEGVGIAAHVAAEQPDLGLGVADRAVTRGALGAGPTLSGRDRPRQDPQRREQVPLGDDREQRVRHRLVVLVDVGPVVERRDERSALGRLESVAIDVPDGRLQHPLHRPRDLAIPLEPGDDDGDLVLAHVEVTQRVAIHVHDEAIPYGRGGLPLRPHQHPRRVDGDVPVGRRQHPEDRRRPGCDHPLNFDPLLGHS
ncbi:MAG: winged helix-turn-helix domain-containing protein [Acidimicrobiia bacterium]|nr:winged helix-turn-helix domain-containing protein [Acidimicrobiia bacterium]